MFIYWKSSIFTLLKSQYCLWYFNSCNTTAYANIRAVTWLPFALRDILSILLGWWLRHMWVQKGHSCAVLCNEPIVFTLAGRSIKKNHSLTKEKSALYSSSVLVTVNTERYVCVPIRPQSLWKTPPRLYHQLWETFRLYRPVASHLVVTSTTNRSTDFESIRKAWKSSKSIRHCSVNLICVTSCHILHHDN